MSTCGQLVLPFCSDKLHVFVAYHVGEILESTTIDDSNHALSGDNPADTGTPGGFFGSSEGYQLVQYSENSQVY